VHDGRGRGSVGQLWPISARRAGLCLPGAKQSQSAANLCGVELVHAAATDAQIAAVLGHSTMKQVLVYRKQADQFMLARGGQDKRDAMYEQERLDAMIEAADNEARLAA
jgi:hypothetical protein